LELVIHQEEILVKNLTTKKQKIILLMQFNNGEKILKYKNLHYVVIVLEDIYQHYIFKIIVNILIDLFYFLLLEQPKKQINKFKNS